MMDHSSPPKTPDPLRVAIIGGGLAGLAAAAALSGRGLHIELFEAKRRLGGRAGSYLDRETGELIDHCQHVAMGCCTNYLDFCQRTGIAELFDRHITLYFFGPDGRRSDFRPARWLPAPLHLLPAIVGLKHLTFGDKLAIARAMLRLIHTPAIDRTNSPTVLEWLHAQGHPQRAIERFWKVVLVSALGESLDRASLAAARKVFLDGFIAHPSACHVLVPKVSLRELYDERVASWLSERGVQIHLETPIEQILGDAEDVAVGVRLSGGADLPLDHVILAVPWRPSAELLAPELRKQVPQLAVAAEFSAAPITSVHLWFDQPITDLPHAVLVGRLSQWVFARSQPAARQESRPPEHYYQIVISASHDLAGREREAVRDEVLADLAAIFPATREANLLRWLMITEQEAVFSHRPGLDELRPGQTTPVPNLFLAGDWTRTGWPATMEGAVRSGYQAAEAILDRIGRPERILVPDLPRGWLVKALGDRD